MAALPSLPSLVVSRYEDTSHGYAGTVSPAGEDRPWLIFIPVDGPPEVWTRTQVTDVAGDTHDSFAPLHPKA